MAQRVLQQIADQPAERAWVGLDEGGNAADLDPAESRSFLG